MSGTSEDWVIVGRFGRVHGLKGYVTVHSFTEPRDNILNYANWHGMINKQWQPLSLVDIEVRDKDILTKVEGYSERDEAATLTNVDIAVSREQLPVLAPGEFYWHQLTGMQVINQQGEVLGNVVEMMSTGSNDVLVVEGAARHLIPYLPDLVVIKVDEAQRSILVNWDADF